MWKGPLCRDSGIGPVSCATTFRQSVSPCCDHFIGARMLLASRIQVKCVERLIDNKCVRPIPHARIIAVEIFRGPDHMATRIGTWAPDILLRSNYIEWIAGIQSFLGFSEAACVATVGTSGLSPHVSLRNSSSVGTKRRCSCEFYIETIAFTFPLTHLDVTGFPQARNNRRSMKGLITAVGFVLLFACQVFADEHSAFARITVYWHREGSGEHASWNGARLRDGHCAVDPKKIPYASKVVFPDVACVAVDSGPDVVNRKAARSCGRNAAERNAIVIDRFSTRNKRRLPGRKRTPVS